MGEIVPDREGFLEVGGHRIRWEFVGKGDKETVCLLNGLAMHTRAWYGVLPRLLDAYDVVLYDYLGQGQSSAPDEPYSIPEFAGYLPRVLDALGIEKAHAVGVSYGGFVAAEAARLFPERLHTLTLSGILLSHEELFSMYQEISLRFYRGGPEVFELYTHYMYEKIFGEAFVSAMKESLPALRGRFHDRYRSQTHALIRLTRAQDPFFAALDGNLAGYAAFPEPVLVVPGAEDRTIPPWVQRKLLSVFRDARWEPIEGSGHVVYLEKPDAFFGVLRRFLAAKSTSY
ncbi:MAG: alpha/beta hydrolase [Thermoanaerobaculia bacterium]|jgi:pimeloyl-ACP methyl ester carboxylesterase|nr:alpha/beta hydrolase [Thermoanaerobaculia bacterium]